LPIHISEELRDGPNGAKLEEVSEAASRISAYIKGERL